MESTMALNFIKGNADFANKIYQVISQEAENVLFCPLSAYVVLAMLYQGSAGETAEKLANLLHTDNKKTAAVGYQTVVEELINNISNLTLHLANKLFVSDATTLKQAFQTTIKEQFKSDVESVNFSNSQETADIINQWVETKTSSKIKDLIGRQDLDGLTSLVLADACYFQSKWRIEFAKEDTSTQSFFIAEEEEVDCQMMFVNGNFNYTDNEDLDARILELQYIAENVGMLVILPNERLGISKLEEKLASVDLSKLMEDGDRHSGEIDVSLPRFKIEATTDLKPILAKMGLEVIFNPSQADFSEISESADGLHVSQVKQKTFIDVNEQGTEASAATFGKECFLSGPEMFVADHPFMFILQVRGDDLNTVLFIGKVSKPDNYEDDDDDDFDDDDNEDEED